MKIRQEKERRAKGTAYIAFSPRMLAGIFIITIFVCSPSVTFPDSFFSFAIKSSVHAEIAADAGAVSTATREGRLAVFDDLWQTVADRYYTDNFHGVDWLAQRSLFRPLAANAQGSRQLYAEMRRMLALLQDAHTRVYAPEEKFDWQHPRFISIGISLREVEGRPTVFTVERGSQDQRARIKKGGESQGI